MKRAARRIRGLYRRAWYRLTRRWPRYRWKRGWDGPCHLTPRQKVAFGRLASSYRSRAVWAPEPDYSRRPR